MTTRMILRIPSGESAISLPVEAQQIVEASRGRWASPMLGTKPDAGYYIADCLCSHPDPRPLLALYAPAWQVIGLWNFDGQQLMEVVGMAESVLFPHLRGQAVINGNGGIDETPPVYFEPSRWAGWPACW